MRTIIAARILGVVTVRITQQQADVVRIPKQRYGHERLNRDATAAAHDAETL